MKSFKFILQNKNFPFTLLIHELFLYMLTFVGFVVFFLPKAGNGISSINFSITYFNKLSQNSSIGSSFAYFLIITIIFSIIYLILITGIFYGLSSVRKLKFSELVFEGIGSFFKFLLIFVVFLIISFIFMRITSVIFTKLSDNTFNTMMPLIYTIVKFLIIGIILVFFSYMQAKTRFIFVKENRVKFFNKIKFKEFFSFFGYQILSLLTLLLSVFITYKFVLIDGIVFPILSVIIFQILYFFRIAFKLAAYKSAEI